MDAQKANTSNFKKRSRMLSSLISRGVQPKLAISIPLFAAGIVLASGLIAIQIDSKEAAQVAVSVSAVAAFICGLLLARAIIIPLNRLTSEARAVARGDLTRTLNGSSTEEISTLTDAFNTMTDSLNKYILENMVGGIMIVDSTGMVNFINPATETILSYSSEEVVGNSIQKLFPDVQERGLRYLIERALNDKQTCSSEEAIVYTKTQNKRSIGITISLLKDGVLVSFKDLTEIKRIQEQVRRADRLAALGMLAAGMAHEIRNPLGTIRGLANLISENISSVAEQEGETVFQDSNIKNYVDIIAKESDRLNGVVNGLLNFASPTVESQQPVDINSIIRESLALVSREIPDKARRTSYGDGIEVIEDYQPSLPEVTVEKKKMIQVFINLLMNAFEAAPREGGKVKISTLHKTDEKSGNIVISIEDNGGGIPQAQRERIFDPFYTTKDTGTGLGLAISHQIVAAHKGTIYVSSDSDNGAKFIVELPTHPKGERGKAKVGRLPPEAEGKKEKHFPLT